MLASKRRTALSVPILLAVALAGAVAACAGSSSDSTPPAPHVTFSSFQAASLVIGQPGFTTNDYVSVATTTVNGPYGDPVLVDGILFVPDYSDNRVLAFNGIPTSNGAAASFVLGQTDLVSDGSGISSTAISGPQTLVGSGGKLFLDEYDNDRVLIWNTIPTHSGAPADVVVGQPSFTLDASVCTSASLRIPESIHVVAGKLLVADSGHNRVLVWNSIPTTNGVPADLVLGQQDMVSCGANDPDGISSATSAVTASTMYHPSGIWSDGTRLVVADPDNNRVLVWTSFPTANGQPANLVLGQTSFSGDVANDPATVGTTAGMNYPYFLDSNGAQLFVADSSNNRVLVWNTFPTTNGARADVVLGHSSLTAIQSNDDDEDGTADANPSARTFDFPAGVKLIGTRLFVADEGNNRYLVFDSH